MALPFPPLFSGKIKFDRSKLLGKGGFADVYEGIYEDRLVAVKRILVTNLNISLEREIKLLPTLKHDNVLKVLAVEQDADFRYIVLELCQGTLHDVINGTYKGVRLPSELAVLYQIADGLHYIHEKNIIHRDVKPYNILISMDSKMKLSDFGFCKKLNAQSSVSSVAGIKGTLNWMAPELHETDKDTGKPKEATKASDIFATGLVFFVFLTKGVHPFGEKGDSIEIPVNIRDNKRIHDLVYGIIAHKPENRTALINVKVQLKTEIKRKSKLIHYYVAQKKAHLTMKLIKELLDEGADPNEEDGDKRTPAHYAARNSSKSAPQIMELLIAKGGDPNKETRWKWTPLHYAAQNQSESTLKTVTILLENGADPNMEDEWGKTSLHYAVNYQWNSEVVKLLIDKGADVHKKDKWEKTPMHYAVQNRSNAAVHIIKLLIECGGDSNEANEWMATPLHYAVNNESSFALEIVKLLVDKGADPNKKDKWKRTPLLNVAESPSKQSIKIKEFLIKNGGDVLINYTPDVLGI